MIYKIRMFFILLYDFFYKKNEIQNLFKIFEYLILKLDLKIVSTN